MTIRSLIKYAYFILVCALLYAASAAEGRSHDLEIDRQIDKAKQRAVDRDHKGAAESFSVILRKDPYKTQALKGRANAYFKIGAYEHALSDFIILRDINRKRGKSTKRENERLALCYLHLSDFKSAVKFYTLAIAQGESTERLAEMYRGRALAYRDLGERQKALADLNESVRLNPLSDRAYKDRAVLYRDAHDDKKYEADLTSCIDLHPELATNRENRARLYLRQKRYSLALKDADAAVSLQPGKAGLYALRAEILEGMGEKRKAAADRDKVRAFTKELES